MNVAMRRLMVSLLALSLLMAGWPAVAQQPGGRRFEHGGPGPHQGPMPQRPPLREASMPARAPEGRMSPEERQQLRRDINNHGRDIYRNPPERP